MSSTPSNWRRYWKKESHKQASLILRQKYDGTDLSDLMQALLEHWIQTEKWRHAISSWQYTMTKTSQMQIALKCRCESEIPSWRFVMTTWHYRFWNDVMPCKTWLYFIMIPWHSTMTRYKGTSYGMTIVKMGSLWGSHSMVWIWGCLRSQ